MVYSPSSSEVLLAPGLAAAVILRFCWHSSPREMLLEWGGVGMGWEERWHRLEQPLA